MNPVHRRYGFIAVLALLGALGAMGFCCSHALDARASLIADTLARAAPPTSRAPPLAGRFALMAASPVAFYRASLQLFLRDWNDPSTGLASTRFGSDSAMPTGVGDPHVENFGTLLGPDGRPTLEADDLDHSGRVPYLWDLRRLAVSLCVAARSANPGHRHAHRASSRAQRDIARSAALAYADGLRATDPAGPLFDASGNPLLEDLFRRSLRDATAHSELTELTVLTGTERRLRRGPLDPDDPSDALTDLAPRARASVPDLLARYRTTLVSPPDPEFFTVLDAARQQGGGVDSHGRLRALVLVRGPSDAPSDDVVLEVKELPLDLLPWGRSPDAAARVLASRATLWSRPDADPLWGATTCFDLPVQVRNRTEAAKSLRVSRMEGPLGTPEALVAIARTLGTQLARIHLRSLPSPPPHFALIARDLEGFADEQADIAVRYAEQVYDDARRFHRLVRRRGPTLGVSERSLRDPLSQ